MRIKVNDGFRLHLTNDGQVWLNTEIADFDGLCIGHVSELDGATRGIVDVVKGLKRMKAKLAKKEAPASE